MIMALVFVQRAMNLLKYCSNHVFTAVLLVRASEGLLVQRQYFINQFLNFEPGKFPIFVLNYLEQNSNKTRIVSLKCVIY